MSFDRRGFLKGVFGGVTAAGLLVTATPREIEAFASRLVKDAPLGLVVPSVRQVDAGAYLYNAQGQVVAQIIQITYTREAIPDFEEHGFQTLRPGEARVEIQARGYGWMQWCDRQPQLRPRGEITIDGTW